MGSKYSYLTKNVALFAVGSFAPKILSFILVPLYTSYLTTAEYGVADLINTTILLLIPVLTVDMADAVMRFALDEKYRKADAFSAAMRLVAGSSVVVCIGCFAASFLNIPGLEDSYLFFFALMYFTHAIYNSVSLFCRGIDCVRVMTVAGILNSAITLSANILFLAMFGWGLNGYLLANIVGTVAVLIYCFFAAKLYRYIRFKIPANVLRDMIAFGFPLMFSVVAWWINQASDRYILSWMSGIAISGVYAVAYKIPSLISTIQGIFSNAWSISAIKEFDKDDKDGFIGNMYMLMNFFMVAGCSAIMVLDVPIAKLLYANDFFEAWKYAPPLMISVVFHAMAQFVAGIFTAVKDTKTQAISALVGALVNVVCNFIFIYYWGAYGAALATLIGYGVTLLMRHIGLRKHIRLRVKWGRDLTVYALLLVQMIIASGGWSAIPLQLVVFAIVLLLHVQEIKQAFVFLKKRFMRRGA